MQKLLKNEPDTYVSTKVAAEMLHVSQRTIQLWVEAEILRAWKTSGGHRKVSLKSIEEVLSNRQASLGTTPYTPQNKSLHILLVEDDEGIREMFKFFFTDWKYPVTLETADDGFDGLVKLATFKPDLLITDISMPGINGYEMLRFLEKNRQFKDIDIIIITGLTPEKVNEYGPLPKNATLFYKLNLEELEPHLLALIKSKS